MNTGQTILTIGALMLLGMSVLTTNRASLQHGAIINQTEVDIYAVSLAQAKIEEASGKAFDHFSSTDIEGSGNVITSLSQLSSPLGPESDDTISAGPPMHYFFDDFDDYNYYSGTNPFRLYVDGVDTFHIQTTVFYVDTTNPEADAHTRTWHKRMVVKVWPTVTAWGDSTGKAKPDTITMSYIYSYWWFR
jgi:hypothetical protein